MLCFTLPCFPLRCFALLCFGLLCFALLCFALLCIALYCFALSGLHTFNHCGSLTQPSLTAAPRHASEAIYIPLAMASLDELRRRKRELDDAVADVRFMVSRITRCACPVSTHHRHMPPMVAYTSPRACTHECGWRDVAVLGFGGATG